MSNTIYDERLELLRTISADVLGIDQLEQTGKLTKDLRIIHIEDLAHALEAAYDAGLMIGHRVARAATTTPGRATRFSFLKLRQAGRNPGLNSRQVAAGAFGTRALRRYIMVDSATAAAAATAANRNTDP
jgi:hypothetical protein